MSHSAGIALWIGATVMASTSAFSADLPPQPVYKVVPALALTWTGAYVGGVVGYGWGESSSLISPIDTILVPFFQSQGSIPTSLNPKFRGFMGGGEIGYNWQSGYWLTGLEADFSYSGLRGDATAYAPQIGANPETLTSQSARLAWFGTVRGRIGVLMTPDMLLFGTGGLAYGRVKAATSLVPEATSPCSNNVLCSIGSTSETRLGWTIGGGLETRITSKWTAKIEYLHFDLGSISDTAHSVSTFLPSWRNKPIIGVDSEITGDIVRIGLNYQL